MIPYLESLGDITHSLNFQPISPKWPISTLLTFTCSNSPIEILEKVAKDV